MTGKLTGKHRLASLPAPRQWRALIGCRVYLIYRITWSLVRVCVCPDVRPPGPRGERVRVRAQLECTVSFPEDHGGGAAAPREPGHVVAIR